MALYICREIECKYFPFLTVSHQYHVTKLLIPYSLLTSLTGFLTLVSYHYTVRSVESLLTSVTGFLISLHCKKCRVLTHQSDRIPDIGLIVFLCDIYPRKLYIFIQKIVR